MNTAKLLKEFDFTEYETKVFHSLIHLSSAKASDIAKHSGVPNNKVYECLIKLAQKGFIASLDVTPRVYKITGIQKFKDVVEEKEDQIKQIKSSLKELEKNITAKQFDVQDIAMVLKGKKRIMQMLNQVTPTMKKHQYNFGGSLIFSYKGARVLREAIQRGVEVRFIVHKDPSRKKVYEQWRKIGVKIRFYPKEEQKSIRFSTFDDKICRFTIGKPQIKKEEDYISFWVESPAFASLLKDQFLEMWKKSKE